VDVGRFSVYLRHTTDLNRPWLLSEMGHQIMNCGLQEQHFVRTQISESLYLAPRALHVSFAQKYFFRGFYIIFRGSYTEVVGLK